MPIDLIGPVLKQIPGAKVIWPPALPGDSYIGRFQPANYRLMVQADDSWVYACARINAQNVAKAELHLYQRQPDGDRIEITDHPLLRLLEQVNPYMNKFDLKEITDLYQELTGNAYWYLAPTQLRGANGQPIPGEIWPLMSHYLRVVPGRDRLIEGYIYQLPYLAQPVAFSAEEIVHFKFPNPDSLFYGKGPLEGARFVVDSNEFQKRYEVALFKNMARPDGIISTDKELSEAQVNQIRAQWRVLYGGPNRAGNIAVMQRGMKYEPTAMTPKEMDFLRGRIATREEIMAIFGVPGSKMGLTEHVNRANAVANDLTYQSEAILPRLRRFEEKLNERLVPIYDETLEVEFENPVPDDQEFELAERQAYLEKGVITINEIRGDEGLAPVPWGDVPLVPTTVASLGSGMPSGDVPNPDTEGPVPPKMGPQVKGAEGAWRRFVHAIRPVEQTFYRNLQEYFIQQRRIVEANLNKLKQYRVKQTDPLVDLILFPLATEQRRLADRAHPYIQEALTAGTEIGKDQLGSGVDFDVLNPWVNQALRDRVEFFSRRVNQTTAQALTDEIAEGVSQGEAITQIANRVQSVYGELIKGFRGLRIARTEVISAANGGALLSYRAGGATEKQWVTAGDERVRPTHQEADGQTVGIHQKFIVGGEALDHPGDPLGSPEEIINCRCTLVPIINRDE